MEALRRKAQKILTINFKEQKEGVKWELSTVGEVRGPLEAWANLLILWGENQIPVSLLRIPQRLSDGAGDRIAVFSLSALSQSPLGFTQYVLGGRLIHAGKNKGKTKASKWNELKCLSSCTDMLAPLSPGVRTPVTIIYQQARFLGSCSGHSASEEAICWHKMRLSNTMCGTILKPGLHFQIIWLTCMQSQIFYNCCKVLYNNSGWHFKWHIFLARYFSKSFRLINLFNTLKNLLPI